MTTPEDISRWFDKGKKKSATHMIIVCDTSDFKDYPVYVSPKENAQAKVAEYHSRAHPLQVVRMVFKLSIDKKSQLKAKHPYNF